MPKPTTADAAVAEGQRARLRSARTRATRAPCAGRRPGLRSVRVVASTSGKRVSGAVGRRRACIAEECTDGREEALSAPCKDGRPHAFEVGGRSQGTYLASDAKPALSHLATPPIPTELALTSPCPALLPLALVEWHPPPGRCLGARWPAEVAVHRGVRIKSCRGRDRRLAKRTGEGRPIGWG